MRFSVSCVCLHFIQFEAMWVLLLVNRALFVTSHWGDLDVYVCMCSTLGPWWCGAVSVHLLDEKACFSSSNCLKGPPNFITSRQLAGHQGAQGVEWCVQHVKAQQRWMQKDKDICHLMTEPRVLQRADTIWPFLLLSKHSVETPQHSGKKIQNTHPYARGVDWVEIPSVSQFRRPE